MLRITIKCVECGHENNDNYKFCQKCGNELNTDSNTIFCSECGHENKKEYDFCQNCGQNLKQTQKIDNTAEQVEIKRKQSINTNINTNPQNNNPTEYVEDTVQSNSINNSLQHKHKNLIIALILSVIPGLGLVYIGLKKRGFLVFIVANIFLFTDTIFLICAYLFLLVWFIQIIDTITSTLNNNKNKKPKILGIITTPEGW